MVDEQYNTYLIFLQEKPVGRTVMTIDINE